MPGGQSVYAKVFDDPVGSGKHWLKRVFGLHPAVREWRALMRLKALGVPAVRAIAVAKYAPTCDLAPHQRSGATAHRFVLLTAGVENAITLISACGVNAQARSNQQGQIRWLCRAVSNLWAFSHNRGYAHPDGHPGNILIVDDPSKEFGGAHALFIDPASHFSIRRQKPVSANKSLTSLAMLDQYFHRIATRSERLRFWRDYWVQRNVLLDRRAERRLIHRLGQCAVVHRVALGRQRDRRLRGEGKYFGNLRLSDGWQARVVLQLERRHVFQEALVPDRTFEEWASLCTHILRVHSDGYLPLKQLRIVRRPADRRGPWAKKLFLGCHRLRHRDIAAPLVLGYLQNRTLFTIRDEYLILPGAARPSP